jgi:acyl-CoA hydrolase
MATADEAAALVRPTDDVGIPLGPGAPPRFLEALGRRTDWTELRLSGALLAALSDVFLHPNVHYLSGFFGPLERMLRDQGANIGFVPADFRRFTRLYAELSPRIMSTAAAPPDADGWCSLSLHAGASVGELRRAGADPERLLVVEASPNFPRTFGVLPDHRHALHVDEIDVLIESDAEPASMAEMTPTDVDRAIAGHVSSLVPDGATLQTGIGAVPSMVATLLAEGPGGDYGIHSEMFTTGLMRLHQAGKVTNRKGTYDGLSVATFAFGDRALYDWLHENEEVAFLPVELVNAPEVIAGNRRSVTLNGAMSIDISGQVVADTIDGRQYSGIGGHEDFVSASALSLDSRSIICMPSTATVGGQLRSRIVPWFGPGTVVTTPRHHVDLVVTEYGIAELQGHTVHQRGEALAAVAHPDYREELLAAAVRASRGESPVFPALS